MAGRSRIAAVTRRIRPSSNPARPGSGAAPPCGITRSGATEAGAGADLPSAAADVEEAPGHAPLPGGTPGDLGSRYDGEPPRLRIARKRFDRRSRSLGRAGIADGGGWRGTLLRRPAGRNMNGDAAIW